MTQQINFMGCDADIYFRRYNNGRYAIELSDPSDGELLMVATVNLPHVDLEENEVIIKDYSENEGMYLALLIAGIIGPAKRYVQTGFVTCPVCDLIPALKKEIKQ